MSSQIKYSVRPLDRYHVIVLDEGNCEILEKEVKAASYGDAVNMVVEDMSGSDFADVDTIQIHMRPFSALREVREQEQISDSLMDEPQVGWRTLVVSIVFILLIVAGASLGGQ